MGRAGEEGGEEIMKWFEAKEFWIDPKYEPPKWWETYLWMFLFALCIVILKHL